MTIGEKIKARRRELHMTTEELGDRIGVQRSAVTKYEKGHIELKASQIIQIAKALEVRPVDLLDDDTTLTPEEYQLIKAWRSADAGTQSAVRKLLDLPDIKTPAVEQSAI